MSPAEMLIFGATIRLYGKRCDGGWEVVIPDSVLVNMKGEIEQHHPSNGGMRFVYKHPPIDTKIEFVTPETPEVTLTTQMEAENG